MAIAVSGWVVSGLGSVIEDEATVAVFWMLVIKLGLTVPVTVKVSDWLAASVKVPVVKVPVVSVPLAGQDGPLQVQVRLAGTKSPVDQTSLSVMPGAVLVGPKLVTMIVYCNCDPGV